MIYRGHKESNEGLIIHERLIRVHILGGVTWQAIKCIHRPDSVSDLQRLLEHPHTINGKAITVVRQRPKKKLPLDPVRMHVQGLSETTTEDCLRFYLEKFSDVEVEKVCFGSKNNALATFEAEPGNYV